MPTKDKNSHTKSKVPKDTNPNQNSDQDNGYIIANLIKKEKIKELKQLLGDLKLDGYNLIDFLKCSKFSADDLMSLCLETKNVNSLKLLVGSGANPRYNNDFALRWASTNGMADIVDYLLVKGCSPAANNFAAPRWAYDSKQIGIAKSLLIHCNTKELQNLLLLLKSQGKYLQHPKSEAIPDLQDLTKTELHKQLINKLSQNSRSLTI